MFWLGLTISIVGGLIGILPVREWLSRILNKDLDRSFKTLRVALILLGAGIAAITYVSSEREKGELKTRLNTIIEEREQFEEQKKTPPIVEFRLEIIRDLSLIPILEVKNNVPINFRWHVGVSRKEDKENFIIIGGLMMDWRAFYPTEKTYQTSILPNRAVKLQDILKKYTLEEYYIALNFTYKSVYYEEVGYPKELTVTDTYRYILTPTGLVKVE